MQLTKTNENSKGRKWLLITGLVVILLTATTFLVFNKSNEKGTKTGVLVNFVERGFLFKTYEGQLKLVWMTENPDSIWNFSVTEDEIADTLMKLQGQKLLLHYHDKIKPMTWQGESDYFVDGVEIVNN